MKYLSIESFNKKYTLKQDEKGTNSLASITATPRINSLEIKAIGLSRLSYTDT